MNKEPEQQIDMHAAVEAEFGDVQEDVTGDDLVALEARMFALEVEFKKHMVTHHGTRYINGPE